MSTALSTLAMNAWHVVGELAPWLLLGAGVSGLLHVLLPPGLVRRQLRGRAGVLKAVALGVPLPLCSCGVIPAGIGLKADGASDGATVGFLTATPQTGVDSILVSGGLLGLPFALMKVIAALITGVVSGTLVDLAGGRKDPRSSDEPATEHATPRTAAEALAHAIDMIRMIWRWLVFGILVSAALSTWLPTGSLSQWGLSGGPLAYGLVLLASVPLYVCATASVPIAAALVAGGMSTGAAMVFLMAGPATNVATLGAVLRAFGRRTLAIYLGTIVAGSVAFGLLYDGLVRGAVAVAPAPTHVHGAMSWPALLSSAVLLGMFVRFASQEARTLYGRYGRWRTKMANAEKRVLQVQGMTCNGCAARLQRVLQRDEEVEAAAVSFEAGRAEITGDASLEHLAELVEGAGFEVVG